MKNEQRTDAKPSGSGFASERKKEGADAALSPSLAEAKRSEFLLTCDGCGFLRFEDRPHGVKAARCANRAETGGAIRGYGRTVEVFNIGVVGPVVRPVWCREGRKTGETPHRKGET